MGREGAVCRGPARATKARLGPQELTDGSGSRVPRLPLSTLLPLGALRYPLLPEERKSNIRRTRSADDPGCVKTQKVETRRE
jgi:hypothetical protein